MEVLDMNAKNILHPIEEEIKKFLESNENENTII